jgi:teichoic acid D-alanine hydrolase
MRILLCFLFFIIAYSTVIAQKDYDKIKNYFHSTQNFNGVILAASDGKIDYVSGIGLANRQNETAITTKTKFKVASITKTFTAVMILKLREENKIEIEATIGKYLPEYQGEGKSKVTIHHLLTYSSGIPNCEGNTGIAVYQSPISVDDFIIKYCSGNLEFEPGKQFSYNNGDYIILGRIIEKITGKTFEENLNEMILDPLEMHDTDMLSNKDIISGLAETYNYDDSTKLFYRDAPMYIENYFASGAMYSTAEDLLKFDQGIFNYKLLSKKSVDLMLTPYPELYGVANGFWVTENTYGTKTFLAANRQGSIWGANADWLHLIADNKTIIVLSNTDATNLPALTEQLVLVATGQPAKTN